MIVNQKQLASILGISARRVRQLQEEGFFEFAGAGKGYALEKCVPEYIEYKVKAEMGEGTLVSKEKEAAEHEKIKKEISKLKLRKLKKEIHEASDVEHFLGEMLLNFRNRLLSVPAKLAPIILGEKDINVIIETLNNELLETLDELSEYDPDTINGDEPSVFDDDFENEEEN